MQGKDDHLTIIDGSYGQGGGQTLRKSLALSAIHRKPATLLDIRANRNNPHLRPQPFKGLKALVHVPRTRGDEVGMGAQRVHGQVGWMPRPVGGELHCAFQKRGERQSEGSMETSSA